MKAIGTAKLTHFGKWIAYIDGLSRDELYDMGNNPGKYIDPEKKYGGIYHSAQPEWFTFCKDVLSDSLRPRTGWSNYDKDEKFRSQQKKLVERLKKVQEFHEEFDQPIFVTYWSDEVAHCYLGNPGKGFVVLRPAEYMEFVPAPDWSGLTTEQVKNALCGSTEASVGAPIVPVDAQGTMTVQGLNEQLEAAKGFADTAKEELERAKRCETGELAELKKKIKEMEAELLHKKELMVAELEAKMKEAERQKEYLDGQIYLLDSQIYDIYCYAGETVKFVQLRKGKNAPDTEPVIIHQKLRFLDEDLGRMTAIYQIDWEKISMFEDFLKYSPAALEMFCPNEKCVMLAKVSRTGLKQAMTFHEHFQMLEEYEYYHGNAIGIIVRNGENVYIGWTDPERVHIKDDLIVSHTVTDIQPAEAPTFTFKSDEERYYKQQKEERFNIIDGLISRKFVYSILQGVVDRSNILSLPRGTNIGKQGPLVQFAVSDMWLTDNRYGTFNDIVARCNRHSTKGDMVLTLCMLVPHNGQYERNDRGIGYACRTHDCEVPNCRVMPINLVRGKERVRMYTVRYEQSYTDNKTFCKKTAIAETRIDADEYDSLANNPEELKKRYYYLTDFTLGEEIWDIRGEVYVSVPKGKAKWGCYTGDDPRANFRLDKDEYLNLTFMNSCWLLYAINTKNLGGWSLGGAPVEYAYAIRYLNTALDYIRDREKQEKALLDAIDPKICEDPDWPVKLSEWKLSNDERPVRQMNEFQSKRFARSLGYKG